MPLPRPALRAIYETVRLRRAVVGARRPSWTAEYETLAELLRRWTPVNQALPLARQRILLDGAAPESEAAQRLDWEHAVLGGVPCVWARPRSEAREGALVYLHGGGYVLGSLRSHRDVFARLAELTRLPVLAVDYRLAPEHPIPAQLEDALVVLRALRTRVSASRTVIAGESAGGGLTLATLCALRDANEPLPAAAACLSGWFDLAATGRSNVDNEPYDYLPRSALARYARWAIGPEGRLDDPRASPLHAALHGLPPLLLQAGGAEAILDDSVRVAERGRAAGSPVALEVVPDMVHAFQLFGGAFVESQAALERVARFLVGGLGAP
jgi:epsilon-lactone hydrolase